MRAFVLSILFFITSSAFFLKLVFASDYEKAFRALNKGDYEKAAYFLSFYASNGDAIAQYNMGLLYRDGLGVEKNQKMSLSWLILAAQQDHMLANYAVAKIIHKGSTNNVSLDQALEFYKQAAFLGHAVSPIDIGQIYFVRNESPRDLIRAFVWWSLAAERNAPGALENIEKIQNDLSDKQMHEISRILEICDIEPIKKCLSDL